MNITPKLSLNKHPKDNINLSFVNAQHVKISNDESCIANEDSIKENSFIHEYLFNYYGDVVAYRIIGIIPCNNELVIIVKPSNTDTDSDIFRYQEPINNNAESMYCAYGGVSSTKRFKYQGGLIKGAFTYNVEDSLIVAIAEYNVENVKIPLRTINLGNANDSSVYNDKELSNSKLSISPEVKVPVVNNLDYVAGSAYKGWYYIFIRYKINSIDYTQWHSIGVPVYIDTLEQYQIIRYCFNRDTKFASSDLGNIVSPSLPNDGYGVGSSDYFSNNSDIAKETFKIDLHFDQSIDYDKYQIGVICASKAYTKAFRTSDIFLNRNYEDVGTNHKQQYVLDNKSLIEYNIDSFINDNFNYFNIKNIRNYQNRLYISNYLEDNANDDNISQDVIDSINVKLEKSAIADYGLVYDTALISDGVNQYDTYEPTLIPLHTYLNISEEVLVTVTSGVGGGPAARTAKAGQFYITSGTSVPGFAYIELREPGILGSTNVTKYGEGAFKGYVYLTINDKDGVPKSNIVFNSNFIAMSGGMKYINTNIDFKKRKKESTLIPGEIYNLFIHYTNKYNHSTNGYRLQNKTIWTTEDASSTEIIPIPFTKLVGTDVVTYYAAMGVNENVAIEDISVNNGYNVNVNNIKFYKTYGGYGTETRLKNKVTALEETSIRSAFIEYFSSYSNIEFVDVKWYQVSYGPGDDQFHLFINNNGDRLFKIPVVKSFDSAWDGFPGETDDFKTYQIHSLLRLSVDNVEIPEGYDGFYISYEKFEPQARATGLLTRNDFRSQDYIEGGAGTISSKVRYAINTFKSDKMFFYSSIYDVSDSIKLDYNIMRIEAINPFKKQDIPEWDYFQRNSGFNFVHDMNKPQVLAYGEGVQKTYPIPEYKIVVADSASDNRMGLGTALQIADSYNLFTNYKTDGNTIAFRDKINLYRVTLLNTTRDIYMSNSKSLIKLTNVIYRNESLPKNYKYNIGYIDSGYNGHYTYDGVPVYESRGLSFNTTTNKATTFTGNDEYYKSSVDNDTPHTYQNDYPFLAYLQFPVCTDVFFESKSFKNAPTGVIYMVKSEGEKNRFAKGAMVIPANSIDLFENRQSSADIFNPKTYINFREDLVSIEQFDKTLRRSNVIQDESRANGWRNFPVEGYKNITENKGKITNIIGIGTVLLVHTEHSLFMFNTDSTLRTQDKDIQLVQPDAFEVSYKEVFTSDKGFGGLQDDKSYIIDEFGYIFYSEDVKRIYLFDNGQLHNIDEDIINWLAKYKPINVRMANDRDNNRILIKFDYIIAGQLKHTIISYNYKAKCFVSQHLYHFDEAYSTKTKLYLQCNNSHTGCSLHNIDYNGSVYCKFDNILDDLGTPIVKTSKISIIINNSFSVVKFLEHISYKITKYIDDTELDFTNSPVEEYMEPFAGNTIRVYNNMTDTNILDISVDNEAAKNIFANFNKPYWDLGVWNFSYLRNNISQLPNGVSSADMSRIFGNYFIIEFTFNNIDGRKVEFEELNYNISE